MGNEREPIFEGSYSEKQQDQQVDQIRNFNKVVAGNIFDPKKKKEDEEKAS